MKERPILFSTPMVQAILEGRKTMTRRVVKFPKNFTGGGNPPLYPNEVYDNSPYGLKYTSDLFDGCIERLMCSYGQPGDRLWVRETWAWRMDKSRIYYKADENLAALVNRLDEKWKPSIFMPRSASRITLEITSIHVERLQDISEKDAKMEGVELQLPSHLYKNYRKGTDPKEGFSNPFSSFETLWRSINGNGYWDANPWVWVIEFQKIKG